MRAVNLLPDDRQREQEGKSGYLTAKWVVPLGAGLLTIACIFVGFTFVNERNEVSNKRETLQAFQQEVTQARAQQATTTTALNDTQARLAAFNTAALARISWDTLLAEVSRVLPSGAWLSNLTVQSPTPSTSAPGATTGTTTGTDTTVPTAFVVSGYALSHDTVAVVMERLALVPMLTDVTLQRSQRSDIGGHRTYQFTMSANVNANGER